MNFFNSNNDNDRLFNLTLWVLIVAFILELLRVPIATIFNIDIESFCLIIIVIGYILIAIYGIKVLILPDIKSRR